MAIAPIIITLIKAFLALWSLITMAVAAGFIAELHDRFTASSIAVTNLDSANAIIAASILSLIFFVFSLVFIFTRPASIFISVLVDVIVLTFLFILTLGAAAGLSSDADFLDDCGGFQVCKLGQATLALAWILALALLALLLFQIIWTTTRHGRAMATWETPFNELLKYGAPTADAGISNKEAGVPMTTVPGSQHAYAGGSVNQPPQQHTGQPGFEGPQLGPYHPTEQAGQPLQNNNTAQSQGYQQGFQLEANAGVHPSAANTGSVRALPSAPLGGEMGPGGSSTAAPGVPVTANQQLSEKVAGGPGRQQGPITQ